MFESCFQSQQQGSPGLVVKGGQGFESWCPGLDIFCFIHVVGRIVFFDSKETENKLKRGRGWLIFNKYIEAIR